MLPSLSADTFACVAAFLPASDVGILQQSSRSIQLAGTNPAIWKAAFERLGRTVDSSSDAQASEDWKLRFVEQCLYAVPIVGREWRGGKADTGVDAERLGLRARAALIKSLDAKGDLCQAKLVEGEREGEEEEEIDSHEAERIRREQAMLRKMGLA